MKTNKRPKDQQQALGTPSVQPKSQGTAPLQKMANNSPQVQEAAQFQAMANNSAQVQEAAQLKPMGNDQETAQLFSADTLYTQLVTDLLPNLSTASGDREEDFQAFQGDSPVAREAKKNQFMAMLQSASQLPNVYNQAARVSSNIKANQYFVDSNTRLSTAAVYRIYEASDDTRLKATPLETFAAIAEKELDDSFDYVAWLESKQVPVDSDEAVPVPSADDLENISKLSGYISEAFGQLNSVLARERSFKEDHPTMERAKQDHQELFQQDPRVGEFDPEDYDDELYETAEAQHAAFLLDLDVDEETIFLNQELIRRAQALILNGRFLESISTRGMSDEDLDTDNVLEKLAELIGIDVIEPVYE